MLVTVNELVGLVCVRGLLTLCLTLLNAVCKNQPVVPHIKFTSGCVQALEPGDHLRRAAFATEMLQRIDEDNDYLMPVCFSDGATFHTSGKVNSHNVRIWGLENPRVVLENERNSPKMNVWCAQMHKVIWPFFSSECTICTKAMLYLDMIELYAFIWGYVKDKVYSTPIPDTDKDKGWVSGGG
ncbi:hypothetical protein B7P43_G04571 [Cryptotermes secundus]|uniref:DDE Tnp4 domain-containing protein n=1 Tax=Cryptotermes secundus TaxID=105785 RepID=A0A2J7QLP8_9NEOP|nr:hypothetical protein B7P43_G04571 [Cryptotermes secundus]